MTESGETGQPEHDLPREETEPAASAGVARPDWKSQFEPCAWRQIWREVAYLVIVGSAAFVFSAVLWWWPSLVSLDVESTIGREFQPYALAWLAGLLGGTTFAMKWLHHAVGKGPYRKKKEDEEGNENGWRADHILWRLFVPPLSAVMSVAFYALLESGLLNLEITTDNKNAFAVGAGFIVGYFSDRAAAKLREVAYVLFGEHETSSEGRLRPQ